MRAKNVLIYGQITITHRCVLHNGLELEYLSTESLFIYRHNMHRKEANLFNSQFSRNSGKKFKKCCGRNL